MARRDDILTAVYEAERLHKEFDPKARRNAIACDAVQALKDEGYVQGHGLQETATLRMNQIPGPRTRREVLRHLTENPWSP